MAAATNVCNLDSIYHKDFAYSLPRETLESFLSGAAFDNPTPYSQNESKNLEDDINDLFQALVPSEPKQVAIISAGAPGSGKTTLIRQQLKAEANYPYVCPDDVCLKGQTRTYLTDIKKNGNSFEAKKGAYTKWRPGSNGATHILLAHLIKEKRPFYYGTTCSSPMTYKFFEFLKEQGYRIKVLHVSASDDVRWGSIQERDKMFIQTTEEDIREKGLLVPQRVQDTFLPYADEIAFYYRSSVSSDAIPTATWIRKEDGSSELSIHDNEAYEVVQALLNAVTSRPI